MDKISLTLQVSKLWSLSILAGVGQEKAEWNISLCVSVSTFIK